jgi:hypothetical protein
MEEQSRRLRCNQVQLSPEYLRHGSRHSLLGHAANRLDYIKGDEEHTETIGASQAVEHQED